MAIESRKRRLWRGAALIVLAVVILAGVLLYYFAHVSAFTGNNGTIAWGDSTAGRIRIGAYTFGSPGTFATSFRPSTAPVSSTIQFVQTKAATTRNEKIMGYQLADGRLYIGTCISACTAIANFNDNSWSWSTPQIVAANTVTRAFDIAYEQLSGRAMVVYAGNTTGELYYCIWDGSTWGPQSNCAPTNGVNDIPLTDGTTTLTGTPSWVSLSAYGSQMGATRTNDILMAVQDSNHNILVEHWNGSSWVSADRQVLTTTGGASIATTGSSTQYPPAFDIGWESVSGLEMAVYANGTALSYRTSTGSGWSSATTIATLASAAQWIKIASDPLSNRMSMMVAFGSTGTVGSSSTGEPFIWKTNGTTAGWTSFTTLTMAQDAGQNVSTAWEKANVQSSADTPKAIFSTSASANTTIPDWNSWTQSGGLGTWTALTTASNDIIVDNELVPSPDSDIITMIQSDRDGYLRARTFSGSAWGTLISTNLSTTLANTTSGRSTNQTYIQKAFQFTYKPYSPWSMNWRVYDDEDTNGTPTIPMADEDTEPAVPPSDVVRLRVNVAELGGQGNTSDTNGMRLKLQYSSGAGCPDSTTCTWTDVAAQGATTNPWRYFDPTGGGGPADDTALAGTVLDGSTVAGYQFNQGTGAASNNVQGANSEEEYDFTLQNYSGVAGTDYYFRLYQFGSSSSNGTMANLGPIYREQEENTAGVQDTDCTDGTTSVNCTYPTLLAYTTAPSPPVFDNVPSGSTTPAIQVSAADGLNNYLQYDIDWCPTNGFPCAAGGGSFDETASQSGWTGQDADSGLAYQGSANFNDSTVATYTVSPGVFAPNTTYYLQAKAIDPGGTNTWGLYSSVVSFSTGGQSVTIQGGTNVNGGTLIQ